MNEQLITKNEELRLETEKKNNLLVGGDTGFVEFISDLETEERDV